MSADNWRMCPSCRTKQLEKISDETKKVHEAYGKATPAEYMKLVTALESLAKARQRESLAEYYEIHTNEHGKFMVNYSCTCKECGFKHSYKYEQQVWPLAGPSTSVHEREVSNAT